jgi:hypothetical protein
MLARWSSACSMRTTKYGFGCTSRQEMSTNAAKWLRLYMCGYIFWTSHTTSSLKLRCSLHPTHHCPGQLWRHHHKSRCSVPRRGGVSMHGSGGCVWGQTTPSINRCFHAIQ